MTTPRRKVKSTNSGKVPFYDEYLELVIRPKLRELVASLPQSSLPTLHRSFVATRKEPISYERFKRWFKDLGFSTTRQWVVSEPTVRGRELRGQEQRTTPLDLETLGRLGGEGRGIEEPLGTPLFAEPPAPRKPMEMIGEPRIPPPAVLPGGVPEPSYM